MNAVKLVLVWSVLLVRCRTEEETEERDESSADLERLKKIGEEYLRNVMNQLQNERAEEQAVELAELADREKSPGSQLDPDDYDRPGPAYNITAPTPVPQVPQAQVQLIPSSAIPVPETPPGLTADELVAIYNAAVTKLANSPHLHAQVEPVSQLHHPPPPPPPSPQNEAVAPSAHGPAGVSLPGYYYYYYPIKSFLKTQGQPTEMAAAAAAAAATTTTTTTTPMPVQMHATVTMTDSSNKAVEPLFMAISSFIGLALMFIVSVLFVPKFGKLRSGDLNAKDTSHDLIALGRVVFESMEGKDCAERLACEIGRVLRGVHMEDKPLRVLEIVLPPRMGKQIALVRKAAARKAKCNSIPCKLKKEKKKEAPEAKPATWNKTKRKPWKKVQSAHDLWMKRFENGTRFRQPENIWVRNRRRIRPGRPTE